MATLQLMQTVFDNSMLFVNCSVVNVISLQSVCCLNFMFLILDGKLKDQNDTSLYEVKLSLFHHGMEFEVKMNVKVPLTDIHFHIMPCQMKNALKFKNIEAKLNRHFSRLCI